jgi:hypothetical protein
MCVITENMKNTYIRIFCLSDIERVTCSMVEEKIVELKLNMRYKEGYTGILVGQSREFPFIIVQGATVDELVREMMYETEAYFNTFPEERKKAIERYGKIVNEPPGEDKEGWNQKAILVPIPIRS